MTDFGPRPQQQDEPGSTSVAALLAPFYGADRPQPTAVGPLRAGGLPITEYPPDVWPPTRANWWWAGCHGGAGVTTLVGATGCGRDSLRHWPVLSSGASSKVILVARTHDAGLRAAQAAARQWASGMLPRQVELIGLVLTADAPGRLPRQLHDLARLVAGGVPRTWEIGWHEELRLGQPTLLADGPAAEYRQLVASLTSIITGGLDA
ncbi:MAG: DUF6668 family protein [Streptosporangiaceae bacterium]